MKKVNLSTIIGISVTLSFFSLLLVRLEFVQKQSTQAYNIPITQSQRPEETWMNIYQNNKKIGFVHRNFTDSGRQFQFNETIFMQINMMGVIQPINAATEGTLNKDMTLDSFRFDLKSGIFNFSARGRIVKNKLILFSGSSGHDEKTEINLREIPRIGGSIYEAAAQADLAKNTTRSFSIFDPSTLSVQNIKMTRHPDEMITSMGKKVLTKKYCTDFMGAKNCAWLSKDGEVLKETGMLGLTMERVGKDQANEGISYGANADFTEVASIPSNVEITETAKLHEIKIRVTGIGGSLFLNGDRQIFQHNILTITRENLPSFAFKGDNFVPSMEAFLKPSALVQSNDPQIRDQVAKIVKPTDTPRQKAEKIIGWVYRTVEKKPTLSVPNALEVLKNKTGDCNEHSVLTVALLRAAGIPAQMEAGLVYLRGRFYYHAWCVLYLDKWITADAVFNQFPADVTHVRLVRGEGTEQLGLMGTLGKIKLEVLEQIK